MRVVPNHDRVVVEVDVADDKLGSLGILVKSEAHKEKPQKGTVVAIGVGYYTDYGHFRAPIVQVGAKVLFGKYAGSEIDVDGKEYLIIREADILAIVHNDN